MFAITMQSPDTRAIVRRLAGICVAAILVCHAGGASASPLESQQPPHPDGRAEVVGKFGWIHFGKALGVNNGAFFGGEITHHFLFPHKVFSLGLSVAAEGSFSGVKGTTTGGVDVILASVGTTLGLRRFGRVVPYIGGGGGFVVVDGEMANLDVTARLAFHLTAGARIYAKKWLVLQAGTKVFVHDNVQFGGGSGQFQDVFHWAFTAGIGVVR